MVLFDINSGLGLIIAAVVLIVVHYLNKYSKWRKLGIRGPLPTPIVGSLPQVIFQPLHEVQMANYQKYGPVFGFYEEGKPALMVADPDMLKQIFVKEFHNFRDRREMPRTNRISKLFLLTLKGEHWKRMRSIMSPTFSSAKIKSMFPLIEECSNALINSISDKSEFELKSTWGRMTMDVIAKACFATNINAYKEGEMENNKFVKMALSMVSFDLKRILFLLFAPKFLIRRFGTTDATQFFIDVSTALMERRRNGTEKVINKDFLQILLDTRTTSESQEHVPLTDDEIIAQSVLFFAAGYETTGSLLTYASFQLAHHPKAQEKLYQELIKAFPEKKVDYETLMNLPYLDAVCSETLRINPPALAIARQCTAPASLTLPDGRVVHFQPGDIIRIPIYAIHHDPKYWPEPDKFDPERFMDDNKNQILPFTHIPFGNGPRNCIGMRFALFEAKLALVKMILAKRLRASPKTAALDFKRSRFLLAIQEAYVNVESR